MAQFARPDSDVTVTAFTGLPVNTAGNRYQNVDETPSSDLDYNYGTNNTAATYECGLSNVTDPALSTGHTFRYRIAKTNAGVVSGTGNAVTVTASLFQGTTLIAEDSAKTATGTWTEYSFTLSGAEADAITDYTDLRLRFVTSASGGSPANRRGGAVSFAEAEVPDVAAYTGEWLLNLSGGTHDGLSFTWPDGLGVAPDPLVLPIVHPPDVVVYTQQSRDTTNHIITLAAS